MKILSVETSGLYGLDTQFDFESRGPIVAITGPNGAGKSTGTIEAVLLAFYGRGGSYEGSMANACRGTGDGSGWVKVRVEAEGKRLIFERSIKGGRGDKPTVKGYIHCDITGAKLAGPNVGTVTAYAERLFGSYPLALATWASIKGRRGDLTQATGAAFVKLLGEVLGTERLQGMSKGMTEAAKVERRALSHLESQLASAPNHAAIAEEAMVRLDNATTAVDAKAKAAKTAQERLDSAIAALATLEANATPDLGVVREFESAERECARLKDDAVRAVSEYDAARKAVAELPDAERREGQHKALVAKLAELKTRLAQYETRTAWERERDRLALSARTIAATIAMLEAQPGAAVTVAECEANLAEAESAYRKAKAENADAERLNKGFSQERNRIDGELKSERAALARLEARRNAAPKVPGPPDVCETCPLMREFAGLPAEIKRAAARIESLEAELKTVPADIAVEDLTPLVTKGAAAREELKAARAAEENRKRLVQEREKLKAAKAAEAVHAGSEPPAVADPRQEIADVEADLSGLQSAPSKLEAVKAAADKLPEAKANLEAVKVNADKAKARLEDLRSRAEAAKSASEGQDNAIEMAHITRDNARLDADAARDTLTAAQREEAAAGEALTAAKERAEAHKELTIKVRSGQAKAARLELLGKEVFGPRGVPSIILDQAGAAIEDAINEAMGKLTGGEWTAVVHTQAVNKDGTIRDDAGILFDKGEGFYRPIAIASGGQEMLLSLAVRAGVGAWAANQRGMIEPPLFIVDECGENVDLDRRDAMAETLVNNGGNFGQVICITHDRSTAKLFPEVVEVKQV